MVETVSVGSLQVAVLLDVTPPPFEVTRFFPDVPPEAWKPQAKHLTPDGKFPTNFCGWLVKGPSHTMLVDTGLGAQGMRGGPGGVFLQKLQALGVTTDQVDSVVITHLHGDHIGWNVTGDGLEARPTFRRARYYVSRGDWDYFSSPEVLASQQAVQRNVMPLYAMNCLEMVEDGHKVGPFAVTLATPGHTPGHMSVLVSSGEDKAVIVGDLFHSAAQVEEPDWCAGADMNQDLARRTRHAALDRFQKEGFIVAAGHLPAGTSIGKILRVQSRRYWQSID